MVGGVPEEVLQGVADLVNNGPVQLGLFTGHDQVHGLVQLPGQVTNHTREFVDRRLDRNHSNLHYRFVKVGGYTLKVFNLLIESCMGILVITCGKTYK